MARDSIFRVASITKPVTAAAVMMLVEDGQIALNEPVGHWLPELTLPTVVRTPAGPVDDVVPAARKACVSSRPLGFWYSSWPSTEQLRAFLPVRTET